MIAERIAWMNAVIRGDEKLDARTLAVVVEANQQYVDYLDELLDGRQAVCTAVTVKVNGTTIKFKNAEDMAAWITSNK